MILTAILCVQHFRSFGAMSFIVNLLIKTDSYPTRSQTFYAYLISKTGNRNLNLELNVLIFMKLWKEDLLITIFFKFTQDEFLISTAFIIYKANCHLRP